MVFVLERPRHVVDAVQPTALEPVLDPTDTVDVFDMKQAVPCIVKAAAKVASWREVCARQCC